MLISKPQSVVMRVVTENKSHWAENLKYKECIKVGDTISR